MKTHEFKLTNLRKLSTEEQRTLNGGYNPSGCDLDKCTCSCLCIGEVPSQKDGDDSAASGFASQQRELMRKS